METLAVELARYLARTANDAVHTRGVSLTPSFNSNSAKEFPVTIRTHDAPEKARSVKFKSLLHFTRHTQTHSLPDGQYYDLSGMNLRGVNFQGSDLRGANFEGAIISKADFSDAQLDGANLSGAVARSTSFQNASMTRVYAPGARMTDIDATGADVSRADFSGVSFGEGRFRKVKAVGAVFDNASARGILGGFEGDFTDASFKGASITGEASIRGAAKRADFTGANLKGASMYGLDAPHAKFVNTKLGYTCLSGANLRGCDFSGAKSNICTSFAEADMTDALFLAVLVSKTNTTPKAGEVSAETKHAAKNGPAKLARISRRTQSRATVPPRLP